MTGKNLLRQKWKDFFKSLQFSHCKMCASDETLDVAHYCKEQEE